MLSEATLHHQANKRPQLIKIGAEEADVYDDGYLRVEHTNYYVSCGGALVSLPRKEFLIFSRLARGAGRVVTST